MSYKKHIFKWTFLYLILKITKKFNGTERKKTDEQEQKSLPELGKIVDMPLITSSNMISVMRKESSANSTNVDAEKTAETMQKCSSVCKVEKRNAINVPLNCVLAVKNIEVEPSSRISVQSAPNDSVGESECVKRTMMKKSECTQQNEKKEAGIELALTLLKNVEMLENDHPINVTDKIANNKESSLQMREVEGKCENAVEKKFCFENSREFAGEPDGKADEEELTEPPALPTSPPPTTEPRPSFLHGNVHNIELKAKPAVPQKPVTFSMKASLNDGPLTVKKIPNSDYVLPPPSVQNVASRFLHLGKYFI